MDLSGGGEAFFELSFSPNGSLVSTVRRFVEEFYDQILADGELVSKLAVATHEILENAVRYSSDGNTNIRVGVARESSDRVRVAISTKNKSNPKHLAALTATIDEMASAPDAGVYYQMLMRRSAKRTDGSGLGLGRIHAETDMTLSYRIDEDNVHLCAEARFEHPRQS
jgi:hypothetical protein